MLRKWDAFIDHLLGEGCKVGTEFADPGVLRPDQDAFPLKDSSGGDIQCTDTNLNNLADCSGGGSPSRHVDSRSTILIRSSIFMYLSYLTTPSNDSK